MCFCWQSVKVQFNRTSLAENTDAQESDSLNTDVIPTENIQQDDEEVD